MSDLCSRMACVLKKISLLNRGENDTSMYKTAYFETKFAHVYYTHMAE